MTGAGGRVAAALQRAWWQPRRTALAQALRPLSWLYGVVMQRRSQIAPEAMPVPVVVVGNLVVGGAGKTPTVLALLHVLQAAGWRPGVVSRGFGRDAGTVHAVQPGDAPALAGDEPLLVRRRAGVPVWVGRRRAAAARALCAAHADVDVVVSDDGLQHRALPRVLEIVVIDERGVGNGLLLPAGPLREPLPAALPPRRLVLYNAPSATTALPGAIASRSLGDAVPLAAWLDGRRGGAVALTALRGRTLLAAAGIAAPERFFSMLESVGLAITRLPLPDHHGYASRPWADVGCDIVTTEKDAVKLSPALAGGRQVWVVGLDFALPADFAAHILRLLR